MAKNYEGNTPQRPTHTVEDYLMFMYVMERDEDEIVSVRLAELLDVTPATVAITIKRMERDQWIINRGRGDIILTEAGRDVARSVLRRHMLVECLLVDLLGFPVYETHMEAHAIEHAISPALEERLNKVLGNPNLCPHGNPFPGSEHQAKEWKPLTELQKGQKVIIRRIHTFAEQKPEVIDFLSEKHILPRVIAEVTDYSPINQTVELLIDESRVTLGFQIARYIYAEILDSLGIR